MTFINKKPLTCIPLIKRVYLLLTDNDKLRRNIMIIASQNYFVVAYNPQSIENKYININSDI